MSCPAPCNIHRLWTTVGPWAMAPPKRAVRGAWPGERCASRVKVAMASSCRHLAKCSKAASMELPCSSHVAPMETVGFIRDTFMIIGLRR